MTPPDISTTVAGVSLSTCLYNASGPRSGTSTVLHKLAANPNTGAVLSKSATIAAQTGNPQPRTFHVEQNGMNVASFNSEGLPNKGIDYYIANETIDEIYDGLSTDKKPTNKPYIVSLSGKTLDDNLEMIQRIAKANASTQPPRIAAIELNLACPNIIGKPIVAYDVPQMKDILQKVRQCVQKHQDTLPPLGVKLAPYLDFNQLAAVAELLNDYTDVVRYVVTINTVGNALCLDVHAQHPCIASNAGLAGLSGPAVHYTALANVRQLRQLLDAAVDIVGVGGVSTGEQAAAMLMVGAAAVQVGTAHWKEGPACFDRIADELKVYMQQHGFANLSELQKSFHLWTKDGAQASREYKKQHLQQQIAASASTLADKGAFGNLWTVSLAVLAIVLLADKLGVFSSLSLWWYWY